MLWVRSGTNPIEPPVPSTIPQYLVISKKTLLSGGWPSDESQMLSPSFTWDDCQVFVDRKAAQGWVNGALQTR